MIKGIFKLAAVAVVLLLIVGLVANRGCDVPSDPPSDEDEPTTGPTALIPHKVVATRDISYPGCRRMVNRVVLQVSGAPTREEMIQVAKHLWSRNGKGFDEFTVFMYLPGMDTDNAAYGIGEFRRTGMKDFRITAYMKPSTHTPEENRRKKIFYELASAEDRAWKEAEAKYPLEPTKALRVGQQMTLTKETPLMPELDPVDAMASLGRIKRLPAGARVRVVRLAQKRSIRWYQVTVRSSAGSPIGTGWINSLALSGQIKVNGREQLRNQGEYQQKLQERYEAEIAKKHGLASAELLKLKVEGVEKNWPMPPPPGLTSQQPIPAPKASRVRTPDEHAKAKLSLVRNYLQIDRKDKARKILESIIKDYPDTPSAKKAKEELERLK